MSLTEEELLKCPFCLNIYDDPICLACGHSLCAVCLQSLVEQNETTAPCPVCRHSVSSSALPISHYPRNIALRQLCTYLTESSESVTSESKETPSEVLFCNGNHDEQVIKWFCLICRNLICTTCEGSALHRGHAVVSLSDDDNLLEVSCRVKQYCEEEITSLFERLEANQANLNSVRKCVNSTEKSFRLLESNVTSMQREVFFNREKLYQEGYKDEEIRCIEERQILKTKLATSEMFLSKLTAHANGGVKLSEIHHALFQLNAATPATGVVGFSEHDSYSLKLGTELNEVLDQCAEVLIRMKSQFPAALEVSKQELASNSVGTSSKLIDSHCDRIEPTSRFEKGNVEVKLPTNGTQCETSVRHTDPVLHGICQQISQKGNGVNERNGEDVDYDNYMDINNVNLQTERTGEKFYVGFDEPLDIKNYSPINDNESCGSMKSASLSTSETGNDSLPEVEFLSTSPLPRFDHSDVVLVRTFGSRGKENGQFNQPEGLAVDAQSGNLYVVDGCNNRIQVFSQNLEFRFTFGKVKRGGGLRTPLGIAIHPDTKAVIVADSYNNRLQFYSENGDFLEKVGQKGHGSRVGFFDVPNSVAVNSKGHVIVTDTRGHRVHMITSSGIEDGYIFGQKGDGDLQFKHPTGVAVDEDDRIFVADYGNNRIQVLSPIGEFLFSFGDKLLSLPSNVAVSPRGNIFVSDVGNNNVKIFDCKGNFLAGFGSEGTKSQLFIGPSGISWLLDGQLVVGDVFYSNLRLFHCPY